MNKSTVTVGVILLGSVAAALGYFWPFGNGKILQLPGIVEIQEVRLGSKVGGRIARTLVAEGQVVTRGQEIVVFEAPELENQKKQQEARVQAAESELERIENGARPEEKRAAQAAADAAKARLDKLEKGWREEEKRQVASELESAVAELKQAMDDLNRVGDLYRMRVASRAEYDAALGARDRARGRYNAAQAKHDMYVKGAREEELSEAKADWQHAQAKADELRYSRSEDIALARARRDEARAKLQEIEINLKEAVVVVPDAPQFTKAVVEVLGVRPGDIVAPGQPVIRILCAEDLWVKVFVPEVKLGLIALNQEAEVTIDSHPGKRFKGVVVQRASISEFTPRNVQSVDERRHQVFGVKLRVEDAQGVFNAGMAASVTFRLE